jgi:hypothetical protein
VAEPNLVKMHTTPSTEHSRSIGKALADSGAWLTLLQPQQTLNLGGTQREAQKKDVPLSRDRGLELPAVKTWGEEGP